MSILISNLKHLYQRRSMWALFVVLAFAVFGSILSPIEHPARAGRYIGLVSLALIIGFLAAMELIEVLAKPFSFCLPGHMKVVRQFTFAVALAFNLPASLLFVVYPGLGSQLLPVTVCSAFFAGLVFYWIGVALAFTGRSGSALVGLIPLIFFGGVFFGLHVLLERVIVSDPFVTVVVGILTSAVAWFVLADARWARRYCAVPSIGLLDPFNQDKIRRHGGARAAVKWDRLKDHPRPWVENFFLSRMGKSARFGAGANIWGALYSSFGLSASRWQGSIIVLVVAVIIAGYMSPAMVVLACLMPAAMLPAMSLPLYSNMLLPDGRRLRFRATLAVVSVAAVLPVAFVLAMAAISALAEPLLPHIPVRGIVLTFHRVDPRVVYVLLLVIPLTCIVRLIFYRRPLLMIVLVMPVLYGLFTAGIMSRGDHIVAMITPLSVLSVLASAWLVLVAVIYHISMERSLVGP